MPKSRLPAGASFIAETVDSALLPDPVHGDLDLGMVGAMHAYQRWIVRAMQDAGLKELTAIDALVLGQLEQRAHHKRLADICFILNIGDTGVVWYSLRKLVSQGVVQTDKHGKEVIYSVTPAGAAYLRVFHEIREQRLLDAIAALRLDADALAELAWYLRRMSGVYDEAVRVASGI